jgi:hypothetical protein
MQGVIKNMNTAAVWVMLRSQRPLYRHHARRFSAHHPAMAAAAPSHSTLRIQTSRSSSVVKITGIALGWIGSTMAFGAVVKNP